MNGCDKANPVIWITKKRVIQKIFHSLIEMSVINASIIYNTTQPQREGPRKKIPLADLKILLIKQLIHEAAAEKLRREIPIPVPGIQRLAAETHFMETVKDDRNCRVCSKPGQRKRTNVCSVCRGSLIFVEKIVSRSGTPG